MLTKPVAMPEGTAWHRYRGSCIHICSGGLRARHCYSDDDARLPKPACVIVAINLSAGLASLTVSPSLDRLTRSCICTVLCLRCRIKPRAVSLHLIALTPSNKVK